MPRGISDHASVLLRLEMDLIYGPSLWRPSRFWVSDEHITTLMTFEIGDFWLRNRGQVASAVVWHVFKAHARGHYQLTVCKVRREYSLALVEAEVKAQ